MIDSRTKIIKVVDTQMDSTCSINEHQRCEAFIIGTCGSAESAKLPSFCLGLQLTLLCSKKLLSSEKSTSVAGKSHSSS